MEECEIVVHSMYVALDVHLKWMVLQVDVVNTLNTFPIKLYSRNPKW